MGPSALVISACAAAGIAAGWLAWLAARRLAADGFVAGRRTPLAMAAGSAALFAWTAAATPFGPVLGASLALAWALLALAAVDVAVFRLPDVLTLPLTALGLVTAWLLPAADGWADHLAGSVAGYGFLAIFAWGFHRLRGHEGLGLGDAKLMAAAGAWLGWRALPSVLVLACLGGLLWWLAMRILARGREHDPRIPFGAPLCAAVWITWLYGPLQVGG